MNINWYVPPVSLEIAGWKNWATKLSICKYQKDREISRSSFLKLFEVSGDRIADVSSCLCTTNVWILFKYIWKIDLRMNYRGVPLPLHVDEIRNVVCTYTNTRIYMYIYKHVYMQKYYLHLCVYICEYTYMCVNICMCIYI